MTGKIIKLTRKAACANPECDGKVRVPMWPPWSLNGMVLCDDCEERLHEEREVTRILQDRPNWDDQ